MKTTLFFRVITHAGNPEEQLLFKFYLEDLKKMHFSDHSAYESWKDFSKFNCISNMIIYFFTNIIYVEPLIFCLEAHLLSHWLLILTTFDF